MEQRIVQDVNIGANLKKLRRRASMTQAEVAAKLELRGLYVSREIYAQIEVDRIISESAFCWHSRRFFTPAMKKYLKSKPSYNII